MSNMKITNIPINLGNTKIDEFDGVCHEYHDGTKEIIVKREWWATASSLSKRLLIFHELGHCFLDRNHKDQTIEFNSQKFNLSIMSSTLMPILNYHRFRTEYDYEMFTSNDEIVKNKLKAFYLTE
jgi:hypothetical protein